MKTIILEPIEMYDNRWYNLYQDLNFFIKTQPDKTDDNMKKAADFISSKIYDFHKKVKTERFKLWESLLGKYYKVTKEDGSFYMFPYLLVKGNNILFMLYSKCDERNYKSGISTETFDIFDDLNCHMTIEEVDEQEMIDNAVSGIRKVIDERKRKMKMYSNEYNFKSYER